MRTVTVNSTATPFQQNIEIGPFQLVADEPIELGGGDTGPAPYDFLLAGLGACKAITVQSYARRKGWPLECIRVELSRERKGKNYRIFAQLQFDGDLTADQRDHLLEIAERCPVQKTLTAETIEIHSSLAL
jgi:putative redox protein